MSKRSAQSHAITIGAVRPELFLDPATHKPIEDPVYIAHSGFEPRFYDRKTVIAMVKAEDKKENSPLKKLGINSENIKDFLQPAHLAKGILNYVQQNGPLIFNSLDPLYDPLLTGFPLRDPILFIGDGHTYSKAELKNMWNGKILKQSPHNRRALVHEKLELIEDRIAQALMAELKNSDAKFNINLTKLFQQWQQPQPITAPINERAEEKGGLKDNFIINAFALSKIFLMMNVFFRNTNDHTYIKYILLIGAYWHNVRMHKYIHFSKAEESLKKLIAQTFNQPNLLLTQVLPFFALFFGGTLAPLLEVVNVFLIMKNKFLEEIRQYPYIFALPAFYLRPSLEYACLIPLSKADAVIKLIPQYPTLLKADKKTNTIKDSIQKLLLITMALNSLYINSVSSQAPFYGLLPFNTMQSDESLSLQMIPIFGFLTQIVEDGIAAAVIAKELVNFAPKNLTRKQVINLGSRVMYAVSMGYCALLATEDTKIAIAFGLRELMNGIIFEVPAKKEVLQPRLFITQETRCADDKDAEPVPSLQFG